MLLLDTNLGLDAHIGYKDDFENRLAKVTSAPFLEYIRDSIHVMKAYWQGCYFWDGSTIRSRPRPVFVPKVPALPVGK